MARKQQLMCEEVEVYDRHACFFRDACTWMYLLHGACAEEIVKDDLGDDDNGTCAEFTVEKYPPVRPQVPPLTCRTASAPPRPPPTHLYGE